MFKLSLEPFDMNTKYINGITIYSCRACLKPGDISIFAEDILENFTEFSGIEIFKNENMPRYLCHHCHSLLEAAVSFRKKVMETNKILKNVIIGTTENGEHTNEDINKKSHARTEHNYLTYAFDRKYINTIDECLSNDSSIDTTESEPEYLIVKYDTDEESDSIKDNDHKNAINMTSLDDNKLKFEPDNFSLRISETMVKLQIDSGQNSDNKVTEEICCPVCSINISRAYFITHLKQHRKKFKLTRKNNKVECKVCKKFINPAYYSFHIKLHGSNSDKATRKCQCKICNKTFGVHYFKDHMKRVHKIGPNGDKLRNSMDVRNKKRIQCIVCDKNIMEYQYKEHLANHGKPARKYICDHCGKEFIYRSGFIVHMSTHGNDFKYKCEFCDYQAVHQGLLKVHVRIHTKDYNYKCGKCPARFTTKSNLTQHILRHNQQGHIKCYECDRMFHRKRNMEEHHKTIHLKIRDVICDICGSTFSHRDGMLSHQIKVHNRDRLPKQILASYVKVKKNDLKQK